MLLEIGLATLMGRMLVSLMAREVKQLMGSRREDVGDVVGDDVISGSCWRLRGDTVGEDVVGDWVGDFVMRISRV